MPRRLAQERADRRGVRMSSGSIFRGTRGRLTSVNIGRALTSISERRSVGWASSSGPLCHKRPPQLAASIVSSQAPNVACWRETGLTPRPQFGRYRKESGHGGCERRLPKMTHFGSRRPPKIYQPSVLRRLPDVEFRKLNCNIMILGEHAAAGVIVVVNSADMATIAVAEEIIRAKVGQ